MHPNVALPDLLVCFRSAARSCSMRWRACCARAAWHTSHWSSPRMACSSSTLRCLVRALHQLSRTGSVTQQHHASRAAVGLVNISGSQGKGLRTAESSGVNA